MLVPSARRIGPAGSVQGKDVNEIEGHSKGRGVESAGSLLPHASDDGRMQAPA